MANLVRTQGDIANSMIRSLAARVNPLAAKGGNNIVLLDVSASMSTYTDANMQRIDCLKHALRALREQNTKFSLFTFSDRVKAITNEEQIKIENSTPLARALTIMADHHPSNLTIITDGEPDNQQAALDEAKRLHCTINTIFVGDPYNQRAIDFCKALATASGGQFASNPLEARTLALLPKTLNLMLTDGRPNPIAL